MAHQFGTIVLSVIKTFQSSEAPTIKTTDGAIYVCLMPSHQQKLAQVDTSERDDWRRRVSESDRPLLEALLDEEKHENARRRHLSNGRFLTMHKRRRKKLTTRSLNQDPAILDDVLHGQVQCILNRVGDWRFNAFTLETVTGGRSLPVICVHLFHWYGLLDHFNLDVVRLWKLFTLIEEGYHSTNPYHNSIHATDVTQAMHCFLQEHKIYENLKPIEILASLLGAVTHDLDHPGVNQPFLIATSNHLAALYENTSVLENHHWRSAVGCLLESGVAEQIQDIRPIVEKQIASLILATDITRQTEFLETFRKYLDTNTLDMTIAENRHFILQISLKCADISNPCRPWDISKKWSQKVCEEFFRQGDYERQLNLPVTSLCDRFTNSVPKIQVGFFKFVVTPLFIEWHRFLNTKLSTRMMKYLRENEVQWSNRVAAEQAEETKTEISDDDILDEDYAGGADNIINVDNDNEDDIGEAADICLELSDSSEVLLPEIKLPRRSSLQVPKFGRSHFDRRHSVPVNPPKIILPPKESRDNAVSSSGTGSEHGPTLTLREDFESRFDDSFSILSSDSESGLRKSSGGSFGERERPLSAETLLPELNIATMSKSECADRLNIVMHGGLNSLSTNMLTANSTSKQLIRQQTFPPLQPYIRARYMSAGAEMSGCVAESSSSNSSQNGQSTEPLTHQGSKKKSKKDSFKREASLGNGSFQVENKSHKMAKLSIPGQKENVDPSKLKLGQGKRRGSAPVDITCTTITATTTTTTGTSSKSSGTDQYNLIVRTCDKFIRRGSMPVDVIHMSSIETTRDNESLLLNPSTFQRRGSIPFDHSSSVNRSNNFNGKSRNRKKLLRRRSSGGAEILSPIMAEPDSGSSSSTSQAWYRFKRQKSDVESILNRRRGSLPVEVLAICHSGTLRH
ncbi:uncharacterized protein LOC129608962 [Condylostylus longicornis]|nr:uncharacterized protein LOC129608962 [Condylostylus longicornis]